MRISTPAFPFELVVGAEPWSLYADTRGEGETGICVGQGGGGPEQPGLMGQVQAAPCVAGAGPHPAMITTVANTQARRQNVRTRILVGQSGFIMIPLCSSFVWTTTCSYYSSNSPPWTP